MPELIDHIDAIARSKRRAVLYLEFHHGTDVPWRDDAKRSAMLAWLDHHGYTWGQCGGIADVRRMAPYSGQVYLYLPYDVALADYCRLRDHLEYPDGSMRHAGVRFCVMPLDYAMRNAAHDEPGFWDRWAETF